MHERESKKEALARDRVDQVIRLLARRSREELEATTPSHVGKSTVQHPVTVRRLRALLV